MQWPCFLKTVAVWRREDGRAEARLRSDGRVVMHANGDAFLLYQKPFRNIDSLLSTGPMCIEGFGGLFLRVR